MIVPHSLTEVAYRFKEAMWASGLDTDDPIEATGQLKRFHVHGDKRGQRNGWYVLFAGRVAAGAFGCWKRGISERWCEVALKKLPKRDRELVVQQQIVARQIQEAEQAKRQAGGAERAKRDWSRAGEAWPSHPYLVAKNVGVYGIRQLDSHLLVPLWGRDRQLHSLQRIGPDGAKRFVPGGRTKGCFHVIGDVAQSSRCWLAEGYATAASVHEYYGEPCVVAFNASNLVEVARLVREMWASKHWRVMADDDHKTPGNPGKTAAAKALAWADGADFPVFTDEQKARGLTDYNDLARERGKP